MKRTMKAYIAVVLSLCMAVSGLTFLPKVDSKAATLVNAANGRNGYTFLTSNANTPVEGFLYVGNGFSAINCCNENLANGNNLLGQNATTDEAAAYIDLGKDYDISNAKVYQGSTNANFYDSYCRSYKIYYSTEQVNKTNKGNIEWNLAGSCYNGTIYEASTTKIKNAEYKSTTGDAIEFENTVMARSVKLVFDKASCMGTGTNGNNIGTVGSVSLLSIQIYGVLHQEETTPGETEPGDDTLYASYYDDVALKSYNSAVKGYASSNLRSGATQPLTVNNLTNGNTTGTNYIIANTTGGDTKPWFAVDLGKVYDVNKVTVTPGAEISLYANAYPISYKIQVAKETASVSVASEIANLKWKTVATVTDGKMAARSLTFARQNVRYIRVAVDSYADYCSLYELSVYETDDSRLLGEEDDIMNVLFVGNSMTYYNTLCKVVESFARKQGKQIQCTASTAGGKNLIYHSTFAGTTSAIQSGSYDVVILQDIVGTFDGDRLMTGAETLTNMVKEYNPEAKVLFYMPWPVRNSIQELLPYFTYNYIETARTLEGKLAPAGEAYYTLYNKYPEIEWYCNDEKHPHAIGTFVSACSVYYALFPESEKIAIDSVNAADVNKIINDNISYSGDPVTQYDAALLNDISNYAYNYTHAVAPAVEDKTGKTKYTSVAAKETYKVTVDGVEKAIIEEGEYYTLGNAQYGYYAAGRMYPAGYKYLVNSDVEFISVNTLSVSVEKGASIRTKLGENNTVGLKFKANVSSDRMEIVSDESVFTTGMFITTNDIFENNGQILNHNSLYEYLNIINSGWYQDQVGQYGASIVNITPLNYSRKFIARAYITVNYADGSTESVYSDMTPIRSASYVANAVKNDIEVYEKLTEEEKAVIDKVADAE